MNICLPYTYFAGDIFRCLCGDLNIAFTAAPKPGKYTRQIGELYARQTLCEGLSAVLGSLCECCYLGADTAIVFAPCGACSAQRIRLKLQNCLEQSGLHMKVVCVAPHAQGNKELFTFLKENSTCSYFEFAEAKKLFYECVSLAEEFLQIKNNLVPDDVLRQYLRSVEKEICRAQGLLQMKVRMRCAVKKLSAFTATQEQPALVGEIPYRDGDYFGLEKSACFGGFFEKRKPLFSTAAIPAFAPQKLPCNAEKTCI